MIKRVFAFLLPLLFLISFSQNALAQEERHVQAELIAEDQWFQPGKTAWLALRLKMDEGWHTYWKNPGDSGLPITIKWGLPDGFEAGNFKWPYPHRIELPPLVNFGYEGEIFLLSPLRVPSDILGRESVEITASADWLVCKNICIPEHAELNLILPVKDAFPEADPEWLSSFAAARADLPISSTEWGIDIYDYEDTFILKVSPPSWFEDSLAKPIFFPEQNGILDYSKPQVFKKSEGYELHLSKSIHLKESPSSLRGVLVSHEGWRGRGSERALWVDGKVKPFPAEWVPPQPAGLNLGLAMLFSFIGGLILNLMPCVLPVLSIKIMSFIHQSAEDLKKSWLHGFFYSAGIVVSFWVLAAILIGLRHSGQEIGWGFQLQSPVFVIIVSSFFFLFGLNLLGVYEMGASLSSLAAGKGRVKSTYSGSFATGALAVLVATPCTAPFMGAAIGYTLTQPAMISLAVFTFIGLGLATPYFILTLFPQLLRYVPKPGPWMVTMKQIMGFLMMATVLWLAWVLSIQKGTTVVVWLFTGFLVMGLGAWLAGKRPRGWVRLLIVLLILGGLVLPLSQVNKGVPGFIPKKQPGEISGVPWQTFSEEKLQSLREAGKPVFIDFTAAWCLSCQVNDRLVFHSERIVNKFKELGIVGLKADWTRRDEKVTRALAKFGRNSVPLYVFYHSGAEEPNILPELLTPKIVLDALEE